MSLLGSVGSAFSALASTITLYGISLGIIEGAALALGGLWTAVNLYQFYPIGRYSLSRVGDLVRAEGGTGAQLDGDLPTVDVLLPAYEEGAVVDQSIRSVNEAAYPDDRLNLYVIVEAGDADTRSRLAELPEDSFTSLVVPASYPGESNKPRALNYGFEHTDGDVVGIVDAEDVVDPDLFREAVQTLEAGHDFVQARLDMVNEDDGWLNTLFRAEYGFWYEVVLPAFHRAGFPIPLAGTSCLFRRSLLVVTDGERREQFDEGLDRDGRLWTGSRRLAGWTPWDPENVTEDFELGLFLWERGFRVGYLESTTAEESPLTLQDWMKQRTRWKKGKLQTLFKYLRAPPERLGAKAHLFWQSMLPHVGPVNVVGVFALLAVANLAKYEPRSVTGGVLGLGLAFVLLATASFGLGYWTASDAPVPTRLRRLLVVALTLPVYWLLQWAADVRALKQAYNGWLGWERVEHHGRNVGERSTPTATEREPVLDRANRMAALAGIVLVGGVLRLVGLGERSLWYDEIYSLGIRAQRPLADLLVLPNDPHPPLYFILLRVWTATFGSTAVSARLLSVLLSLGLIVAVYRLGLELFDDRVGLIAAGLVALSTFHLHQARTVRMYSLFPLVAALSWLGFARLRTASRSDQVGYVLATVAMLYTHVFGVLVLLAQYVYMGLGETRGDIPLKRWLETNVPIAILASPLFAFVGWRGANQFLGPQNGSPIGWIPAPSTVALTRTLLSYVGYPDHYPIAAGSEWTWAVAGGVAILAGVMVLLAIVTYEPGHGYRLAASWGTGQAGTLLAVALLGPYLLSHAVTPLFAPRYTTPASIGLYLLVGAGVVNVPGRRLRRAILLVLLLTSVGFVGVYFQAETVEDWRAATDAIEGEARGGDVVVLQPAWIAPAVDRYYDGPDTSVVRVTDDGLTASQAESVRRQRAAGSTVWVVTYRVSGADVARAVGASGDRSTVYDRGAIEVSKIGPTS